MTRPPQLDRDRDERAVRDAEIYKLKVAGLTERAIADRYDLAVSTVHGIIDRGRRDLLTPGAEALRQMEADRLDDARRAASGVRARVHYVVQGGKVVKDDDGKPLRDDGPVLKANEQLVRISESWRKLFGLDAPEQLNIALAKRVDEESADIAEVLLKVIPEVLEAADLDGGFRARLTTFALELAGWHLRSLDGEDPGAPRPEAPRPQLALPPGPSAAPAPPRYRERDSVDDVLAQVARFEEEFGSLEDDDED
ncbi:hypothetical protein [Streptomyces sp. YU58]|uniref:hypothetical protein n=1 Tax=Streptomyces sp. SX92 TaxID=3158972 RepID=UPI0027BA6DC0|nr:hypothetical protein [Streptomyces coralus]WLW55564.1 hypothetical protein QU709_31405 [Streptomyces coralus]